MVLVLFRTHLREEAAGSEYEETSGRMHELVSSMPGFVSIKSYTAEDGEEIGIVRFESEEALSAWRNHPEHRKAQRRAREFFYDYYWVQVCNVIREYEFRRDEAVSVAERAQW